jgi:dihydroorotase
MVEKVLKNGKIVNSEEVFDADLVIENGKIVEISRDGFSGSAAEEIDCSGKYILPGAIDAHVHFREPGFTLKEDFESGSAAALAGGVTTILDMPNTLPLTTTMEALEDKATFADEKCKCNFGFHFGVSEENFDELKKADKDPRVHSFKAFVGESTGKMACSYELLERVFGEVEKVVTVHAEENEIIDENKKKYAENNDPSVHSLIRSEEAAYEAVKKVLHLAKKCDHKVHIAHISTALEVELMRKFDNSKFTCEVAPHYLFLNIHEYEKQGNFVKMNPPLRTKKDQDALWQAIDDGVIDLVATDHAPHLFEEKDAPYANAPSGVPGVETMLPLLLNEVNHGRLTIQKVCELVCENPARIFGLSGKGRIEIGADADLVVCDMELEREVENSSLKTKCRWSPFSGLKLQGWPVQVFVKGLSFSD